MPVLMYVPLSCMHLMPRAVILWTCSMAFCVLVWEELFRVHGGSRVVGWFVLL